MGQSNTDTINTQAMHACPFLLSRRYPIKLFVNCNIFHWMLNAGIHHAFKFLSPFIVFYDITMEIKLINEMN